MGVVIEEADESVFWLELLVDSGMVSKTRLDELVGEANELVAIFVASQKTAKGRSYGTIGRSSCSTDHPITRSSDC
jgi:hypothetical protein